MGEHCRVNIITDAYLTAWAPPLDTLARVCPAELVAPPSKALRFGFGGRVGRVKAGFGGRVGRVTGCFGGRVGRVTGCLVGPEKVNPEVDWELEGVS